MSNFQVEDDNENHILDENGNKTEYTVTYEQMNAWHKPREPIHVNDDGHLDTDNRHIVIKDGVQQNHAVSLKQLQNEIDRLDDEITTRFNILLDPIKYFTGSNQISKPSKQCT